MNEIRSILFPTDLTEDARKAFEYSIAIARRTGAKLHLLHALEEPYDFAVRLEEIMENMEEKARHKMEELENTIHNLDGGSDIAIEYHIKRGSPKAVISRTLKETGVDLMVMGTKSDSNLKHLLFGDITSEVILESNIPILTVPVNSKKPYMDRFIFATDYRDRDMDSLRNAVHLARIFDAEIHLLHVTKDKSLESEIKFRGFVDLVEETIDFDNFTFVHYEAPSFTQGVVEYARENPVSMLIITRYKKAFLKTVFWSSDTQDLPYQIHMPMLVMISERLRVSS